MKLALFFILNHPEIKSHNLTARQSVFQCVAESLCQFRQESLYQFKLQSPFKLVSITHLISFRFCRSSSTL
jgi:hypothetical protein